MRLFLILSFIALTGCLAPSSPDATARAVISTRDIAMNRPNTDRREALFRMQPDGTGTVAFLASPDGPQDVRWTLRGDQFCIQTDEGLMQTFGCATLRIAGDQVTLARSQSDSVVTGIFVAR